MYKPTPLGRANSYTPVYLPFAGVIALGLLLTSGCGSLQSSQSGSGSSANADAVKITLTPPSIMLKPGATQLFSAVLSNTEDTRVLWTASAGSISPQGSFTAPSLRTAALIQITATSQADYSAKASAEVIVSPSTPPFTSPVAIATTSLPGVTDGNVYSFQISATGGALPYQWGVSSGQLPSGLQLNSAGLVSGTTKQTGSFSFTAHVTDANGNSASQNLVLQASSGSAGASTPPSISYTGKDGPAQLPLVYLQTAMSNTPSPGAVLTVAAGGNLQNTLNSAVCGDTIELQAGATFTGNFTLPAKSCDSAHWITVRTSSPDSSLPLEGTRINPCYAGVTSLHGLSLNCSSTANVMAKIVGFPPLSTASSANYYRLIGLELTQDLGKFIYAIVDIADTSNYIYVDRCWVHGTATDNSQLGVRFNSSYLALIDSFVSDIHYVETDSQAVGGPAGTGPYKITNNYLEAAGENIMFGGSAATTTPSDIEIRYNHLYKPLTWMPGNPSYAGIQWTVKDLFELKNGQRLLLQGNIFENMWGTPIVITPKNQNNQCSICIASDITFRYNIVNHGAVALSIADVPSDAGGLAQSSQYISIHDDLFEDINRVEWNSGSSSWMFYLGACPSCQPVHDVTMTHLTVISANNAFLFFGFAPNNPMQNLTYTDNIQQSGLYGIDGCGSSLITLSTCAAGTVFTNNVIVGGGAANFTGTNNTFPNDWNAVVFTDYSSGNYLLQPTSPYANSQIYGGATAGADITTLNSQTNGVSQWQE